MAYTVSSTRAETSAARIGLDGLASALSRRQPAPDARQPARAPEGRLLRAVPDADTVETGEACDGAQSRNGNAYALEIDRRLRDLNAREAACRTTVGELAEALCHRKAHHRLGFARLGDYTRERLGLSARELESLAQVSAALRRVPAISAAFARGELSWTRTRLLTAVACAEDEVAWLERARRCSAAELAALVKRASLDAAAGPTNAPAMLVATAVDETLDHVDGEPSVRFRLRCPPRLRALFYDTVERARRVAGAALPIADAAEAIAAEALSGAPLAALSGAPLVPVDLGSAVSADPAAPAAAGVVAAANATTATVATAPAATATATAAAVAAAAATATATAAAVATAAPATAPTAAAVAAAAAFADKSVPRQASDIPEGTSAAIASAASAVATDTILVAALDPFELDALLREAVRALRSVDWAIGRVLAAVRQRGLHRLLGFSAFADYLRDRTAIAPRTARALMAAERAAAESPPLGDAYRTGDLSWLQVLTLAPVVVNAPEPVGAAWVMRARHVTLRRLTDEVAWALNRRDAGERGPSMPPPLDCRLDRDDERQIGARPESAPEPAPLMIEISFTGPASIVALFRAAITAFAAAADAPVAMTTGSISPAEPPWRSCERMLRHVRDTWLALPRHGDPVFARDGWRCTVPACSGRRNLHDHHVHFRSRGGDNRRANRTTVCAWHHLRGIHCGLVRGWGTAPDGIRWQLGIEGTSSLALLDFLGDRYLDHDEVLADRLARKRETAVRLAAWIPRDGN